MIFSKEILLSKPDVGEKTLGNLPKKTSLGCVLGAEIAFEAKLGREEGDPNESKSAHQKRAEEGGGDERGKEPKWKGLSGKGGGKGKGGKFSLPKRAE